MADHIDGGTAELTPQLDAPLAMLKHALEGTTSDHKGFAAALGQERLSRSLRDELTELAQEIGRSNLIRIAA